MKLLLPVFFSVGSAFVIPASQPPVCSSLQVANDLFIDETRASVSKYYGEELQGSDDLKTNACCTAGAPPKYIQDCINNIHPEVVSRYYGCGLCLPQYPLEGATVLDLGSGSGRDVYIASQLVGPEGKVRIYVTLILEWIPLDFDLLLLENGFTLCLLHANIIHSSFC